VRVVFSRNAIDDLEEIGDWIARDSPDRAVSFVLELMKACRAIGRTPRSYRLVDRTRDPTLRRRVFGNYLIFYDVSSVAVEILHVLHDARDYEPLIFPDDRE
jgi:plasmid stabilization system protein ParE